MINTLDKKESGEGDDYVCCGHPESREVNQEIVEIAMKKLEEDGKMGCSNVRNFKSQVWDPEYFYSYWQWRVLTSQVVAGTNYFFDIGCPDNDGVTAKCHVKVYADIKGKKHPEWACEKKWRSSSNGLRILCYFQCQIFSML